LLATALLVTFTTGTASRIFAISLPTVAAGLETDMVGISWALISFQLATAALSLVFGRVGDVYGRQTVYIWGIVLFTASSLLCGLSGNILQLIVYRVLQGVGAAMMQAQGRALAMDASTEESRGRVQGFMTTAHHGGFLLGPGLGGFIIQYIHWRGVFFFLVPLGVVATALGLGFRRLQGSAVTEHSGNGRPAIDYLGAGLLVAVTLALMAILDRQVMETLAPAWRAGAVAGFAALAAGFLWRESRAASPILNLTLFRIRMFAFSTVAMLLVSVVNTLHVYLVPFYLQDVLGLTPSFMGILFLSAPIFTAGLSPVAGILSDRVGPKIPATAGAVLFAGGSLLGVFFEAGSHWMLPTLVLALGGLGSALFFPPNHTALISSVPLEHRGVATGTLYTMFGLGNVFGITVGNFLMTVAFRMHSGNPDALPAAADRAHFVLALQDTFLVTTGIALAAVACSLLRGGRGRRTA
ncbi:MAG: MFS transporter, partial [Deltaproteobacteria bacterium]|nr:MFS transporter [Deltaproteobacteria bacterium]